MAKEMQVPFLGRVPLDPLLSRAAEEGKSAFAESQGRKFMPSLPALQAIIKEILQVTMVSVTFAFGNPCADGVKNWFDFGSVSTMICLVTGMKLSHGNCNLNCSLPILSLSQFTSLQTVQLSDTLDLRVCCRNPDPCLSHNA